MKTAYLIIMHIINLFFLVILSSLTVAMVSNMAAGSPSPFNPVNIGVFAFLLLSLIGIYMYQLKKRIWIGLIIGTLLYISIFLVIIVFIYPLLSLIFLD